MYFVLEKSFVSFKMFHTFDATPSSSQDKTARFHTAKQSLVEIFSKFRIRAIVTPQRAILNSSVS
jgi:hypothetical protein